MVVGGIGIIYVSANCSCHAGAKFVVSLKATFITEYRPGNTAPAIIPVGCQGGCSYSLPMHTTVGEGPGTPVPSKRIMAALFRGW